MQTKPKSNSIITHEVLGNTITFHVKQAGDIVFDKSLVHVDNRAHAEDHGWIQRISDGAAMSRDPSTGKPATPAEKYVRMQAIAEHYTSGSADWSMKREGGGVEGGLLFRALTRLYPQKTGDELRTFIDGLDKDNRNGLMHDPKSTVKQAIDDIRAEAVVGTDHEALLAKL